MREGFELKNLRGRGESEQVGIGGRIILKWIYGNRVCGVDWIHVAQGRARYRALVNTVMNVRVPQKAGSFLTS
jgi:hypothetical protein